MEQNLLDALPEVSTSGAKPPQRLFIPGPTDVLPSVLAAQTAPMIGHRSDEFEALFAKCEAQLQHALLHDRARVYIVAPLAPGCRRRRSATVVAGRSSALSTAPSASAGTMSPLGCDTVSCASIFPGTRRSSRQGELPRSPPRWRKARSMPSPSCTTRRAPA
jgi:hypothetical protein